MLKPCQQKTEKQKPWLALEPQVGSGFCIGQDIEILAVQGDDIPSMDVRCHFWISYYLKGVCNSNRGVQNYHQTLSLSRYAHLAAWKEHYCGSDKIPTVQEVDGPTYIGRLVSFSSSLSGRSQQKRGSYTGWVKQGIRATQAPVPKAPGENESPLSPLPRR